MSTTTNLPFMGGELASFDRSDGSVIEVTTSGNYDTGFARCAITVPGGSSYAATPIWSAASDFYFHATAAIGLGFSESGDQELAVFYDGSNTEVAKILVDNNTVNYNTLTFSLWTVTGGVYVNHGSFNIPTGGLQQYDVELKAGAAGVAAMYVAGGQRISATGLNHTAWTTGIERVVLMGALGNQGGVNGTAWSEVICDSSSHVGDRLKTFPINANSAVNTGWTGSVTNVNEVVLNDSTFVYAASASLTSTYLASGFSLGTYNVVAVGVSARALVNSGSGPQNLQIVLRSGGSNFNSSSIALSAGYQACAHSWTTDPHTSSAWLTANAAGAEGGQESIT